MGFHGLLKRYHLYTFVQRVPRGDVNILGGHNICHFKKKLYSSKIVDEKEILRTVSNAGIYCSRDKVDTVYLV
jgi:predicted transport protein